VALQDKLESEDQNRVADLHHTETGELRRI
jgi:hypothetical protein